MRRLAFLPLLYLSACCNQAPLKTSPPQDGGGTTGGEETYDGGTGGETSGGTTGGGLTLPDSGYYVADAGKPADCHPVAYPTPCSGPGDPVCGTGYICLAFGCQPVDCAACGLAGQQPCPFPLTCNDGSCVAPAGVGGGSNGGTAGNNGSAGNGTAGNGSAGNNGSAGSGSAGNSSSAGNGSAGNGSAGNGSAGNGGTATSGSAGNGSAGNGASGSAGNGSAGNGSAGNGSAGNGSAGNSAGNGSAGNGTGGSAGSGGGTTGGHVQPDGGPCGTSPYIRGDWNMTQDYELSAGLKAAIAGVVQALNDIDQLMQLMQALGVSIPSWVDTLMSDLLNLQYLLSQINVNGTLALVDAGNNYTFTATETWKNVTLQGPNGFSAGLSPLDGGVRDGGQYFYFVSPPSYGVTTCGSVATFDKHDIEGALAGIILPILNEITQIATCADNGPCYSTLSQAIDALVNCQQYTPPPDAGTGEVQGSSCQKDSDCNACAVGAGIVCNSGTCQYGCRNDYDCSDGEYCEADGGTCQPAIVLSSTKTQVTGKTGISCTSDSQCNGNKVATGVFCDTTLPDGGMETNDAGVFVGTCTAGCDTNYACAQGDICVSVAGNDLYFECQTVDTSSGSGQTILNQQDTGCSGPGQQAGLDAGESPATQLCLTVEGALLNEFDAFLNGIVFNFGVATVEGTCSVPDSKDLTNGVWTGDMLYIIPIGGHFSATETSTTP